MGDPLCRDRLLVSHKSESLAEKEGLDASTRDRPFPMTLCSMPVYLAPVSDREQVKDTLCQVKVVNDSVVSHPDPECLDAFHSHVWKLVKHLAESVDPSLDPELNSCGEVEEISVEIPRIYLERTLH